jgi:type IV pilus assembly protein PilW
MNIRVRNSQSGIGLIEILIALVIGLCVTLAVTSVMSVSEGFKRTSTSVNDINRTGSFAMYQIDKNIRSAGSGFSQLPQFISPSFTFGCKLNASKNSTQIWPTTTELQAPFQTVVSTLGSYRLAPVIIGAGLANGGTGSDVIITMSGSAGFGETPSKTMRPAASSIPLANTIGYRANDFLLIIEPRVPAVPAQGATAAIPEVISSCLVEQVSSSYVANATPLSLAGTYYTATGADRALINYSEGKIPAIVVAMGAKPSFNLLGVGANNTLFSYDLLTGDPAAAPNIVADDVLELRAVYGVEENAATPGVLTWKKPSVSPYTTAALLDGSPAAGERIRSIKAIRIGLIMKSPLKEKLNSTGTAVSDTSLSLFSDLEASTTGITYTRTLSVDEQNFRYRVFETLIPIRNLLLSKDTP